MNIVYIITSKKKKTHFIKFRKYSSGLPLKTVKKVLQILFGSDDKTTTNVNTCIIAVAITTTTTVAAMTTTTSADTGTTTKTPFCF